MSAGRPRRIGNDAPIDNLSRLVQRTFDAVPETVARVRRLLDSWLEGCRLHRDGDDLKLAVGELVTNAVRHGKGPVHLIMAKLPDRVRISVHDHGGGHAEIRPIVATGPNAGGWGLRLVDSVVDAWGTKTTGDHTSVWVEQGLAPTAP
jgi:anti-sigma regulatory factor (Ser/Thr protein kinase)